MVMLGVAPRLLVLPPPEARRRGCERRSGFTGEVIPPATEGRDVGGPRQAVGLAEEAANDPPVGQLDSSDAEGSRHRDGETAERGRTEGIDLHLDRRTAVGDA